MTQEEYEAELAFVDEYMALVAKHGMLITTCTCCGLSVSPGEGSDEYRRELEPRKPRRKK